MTGHVDKQVDALIVFRADVTSGWSRWLHPDFQHVFCLVRDDRDYWTEVDFKGGQVALRVVSHGDPAALAAHYRDRGYRVVPFHRGRSPRAPVLIPNCVALVKRVCGIRARCALTPRQLYRHLRRH